MHLQKENWPKMCLGFFVFLCFSFFFYFFSFSFFNFFFSVFRISLLSFTDKNNELQTAPALGTGLYLPLHFITPGFGRETRLAQIGPLSIATGIIHMVSLGMLKEKPRPRPAAGFEARMLLTWACTSFYWEGKKWSNIIAILQVSRSYSDWWSISNSSYED